MPHTIRLTDERTGRVQVIPAEAMHALMDAQATGEATHGHWTARVMGGMDERNEGIAPKERP